MEEYVTYDIKVNKKEYERDREYGSHTRNE